MTVIPFISPNPGLVPTLVHLLNQVMEDQENGLWSSLPDTHSDQITPKTLLSLFENPETFSKTALTQNFFSTTRRAYDFSLIAMLAIQTEQWNRKDLHPLLMTLQGKTLPLLSLEKRAQA